MNRRRRRAKSPIITSIAFSQKNSIAVIIFTLLITLFFLFFAVQVKLNPDLNSLLPEDDITNQNFNEYYNDGVYKDNLIFTIDGDNIFTTESLPLMESIVAELEAYENIDFGIHPFSMITAENKNGRLVIIPMSPHKGDSAWTQEEVDIFTSRLKNDIITKNLIISQDGGMVQFYFPMQIDNEIMQQQVVEIKEILKPLEQYGSVKYLGSFFSSDRVFFYLMKDLFGLLIICFIVILVVYYLSFKSKRAVILPLTVVVFGTIWCLGMMKILGYKLTIINIITPPLVLTLGSSYSIHVLNEYYRMSPDENHRYLKNSKRWILKAAYHVNKTIIVACITTVAGFLSLLIARLDEFNQFGISTSLGITACAILSLFYLPAILSRMKNPAIHHRKSVEDGRFTKIMRKCADLVIRRWYIIIGIFLLVIGGFFFSYSRVEFETNYVYYFPDNDQLVLDSAAAVERIGGVDVVYITLDAPEGAEKYFLNPEILAQVDAFEQIVHKNSVDITHVLSFTSYTRYLHEVMKGESTIPESRGLIMLISRYLSILSEMDRNNSDFRLILSEDKNRMTISFRYRNGDTGSLAELENSQNVIDLLEEYRYMLPEECTSTIWGQGNRFLALNELIKSDQRRSTAWSLVIVFLITAFTFSSIKYGLFSLIPIVTGIMANYIFMMAFGIPFDMVTIAFSSVTVGVGIDDAIHFILRFRKVYKQYPGSVRSAVHETLVLTGRPITLTSVSIISGLMVLSFGSFIPIRYFGILVSVALFNTLMATLFILPACIIFWYTLKERMDKKRMDKKRLKSL
jgi:uncharacterized protein